MGLGVFSLSGLRTVFFFFRWWLWMWSGVGGGDDRACSDLL